MTVQPRPCGCCRAASRRRDTAAHRRVGFQPTAVHQGRQYEPDLTRTSTCRRRRQGARVCVRVAHRRLTHERGGSPSAQRVVQPEWVTYYWTAFLESGHLRRRRLYRQRHRQSRADRSRLHAGYVTVSRATPRARPALRRSVVDASLPFPRDPSSSTASTPRSGGFQLGASNDVNANTISYYYARGATNRRAHRADVLRRQRTDDRSVTVLGFARSTCWSCAAMRCASSVAQSGGRGRLRAARHGRGAARDASKD